MKISVKPETFYCSLPYLLSRVGLALLPIVVLGTIVLYSVVYNHGPFDLVTWQVVIATLIFGVPVIAIGMALYIRLFPVVLTEAEIIGHNERGKKKRLAWKDIVYTGLVRSSGLSCHKLQSKSSKTYLLIPTFLRNYGQCQARLREHGIDLNHPTQFSPSFSVPNRKPAPRRPRTQIEPIREGNYIVITTERTRSK